MNNYPLKKIKAIISEEVKDVDIRSAKLLVNGWDNIAVDINNEYIFRFPKGRGSKMNLEIKILDYLKDKITLPIPHIEYFGKKYKYTGYRKIQGESLTKEILNRLTKSERKKLANDLVIFLHEFHSSFPLKKAKEMGIEEEDHYSYLNLIKRNVFKKIKDKDLLEYIQKTLVDYANIKKKKSEMKVLYNDLHEDNMAFDSKKKKLNGIFDFGDVMIEDVNREFNYLYRLDPVFMEEVIEKYEKIAGIKISVPRVITYTKINEMSDLAEYINKPKSKVYKKTLANIKKWMKAEQAKPFQVAGRRD